MTEWGIEILESDGLVIATEGGGIPLNEEMARYEFRRWPSYGYNCQRIVKREPDGEWETA